MIHVSYIKRNNKELFESFSDISQEAWSVINRHLDDNVIQAMEEAYTKGPFKDV